MLFFDSFAISRVTEPKAWWYVNRSKTSGKEGGGRCGEVCAHDCFERAFTLFLGRDTSGNRKSCKRYVTRYRVFGIERQGGWRSSVEISVDEVFAISSMTLARPLDERKLRTPTVSLDG